MRLKLRKDLAPLRARALADIDAAAGMARSQHITPGAPYAEKLREAEAGGGPILKAEARARGMKVAELAAEVLRRSEETAVALGKIEAVRVKAKGALRGAQTPAAVEAATKAGLKKLAKL